MRSVNCIWSVHVNNADEAQAREVLRVSFLLALVAAILGPSVSFGAFGASTNSNVTSSSNVSSTTVLTGGAVGELYIWADHWSQSCATGQVLSSDNSSVAKVFPWVSSASTSHAHTDNPIWNWYVEAEHQWIACNHVTGEYDEGSRMSSANGNDCS
jgi:hypothetical protein